MSSLEILTLSKLEITETIPNVAIVPASHCLPCPENPYATVIGHTPLPPQEGAPPGW